MLENISEQRGLSDYNLMRRFALMRVQINYQIVEKLMKPGPQLRYIPFEELFDIVHEAHIEKGLVEILCRNICLPDIVMLQFSISTYTEKCGLQKSKARRGVVVKPISSSNVISRGQVDLVDMQVYMIVSSMLLRSARRYKQANIGDSVMVHLSSC